jgi:hypothetical protein
MTYIAPGLQLPSLPTVRAGSRRGIFLYCELLVGLAFLLPVRLSVMCIAELLLWLLAWCVVCDVDSARPRPISGLERKALLILGPPLVRVVC